MVEEEVRKDTQVSIHRETRVSHYLGSRGHSGCGYNREVTEEEEMLRSHEDLLSCSQSMLRRMSGSAWSRPCVAWGAMILVFHWHGGQSQAGELSQVESLVHKNRRADSLFPRHHTDICLYFPETEHQPDKKCVWNTENITTGFVIWKVSKTVLLAGGRCCRPQSLIKQSQPKVYSTKLHTWGQISNNRWAKYKAAQANLVPC